MKKLVIMISAIISVQLLFSACDTTKLLPAELIYPNIPLKEMKHGSLRLHSATGRRTRKRILFLTMPDCCPNRIILSLTNIPRGFLKPLK